MLMVVIHSKNAGTVLRAHVVALTHTLRRVVRFPEQFQQLFVTDSFGIKHHAHYFSVASAARTHFFICRIRCIAARITCGGYIYAGLLPKLALRAPETAQAEHRLLHALGKRRLECVAVDE